VIDFKETAKIKINDLRSVSIVSMILEGSELNPEDQADFNECVYERSAIMEHYGCLPRGEADEQARAICLAEYRQRKQRQ
jgi:hypothetical protein